MSVAMFDSHNFVKQLTKAGMSTEQAEILAQEQVNLVHYRLATKEDMNQMRTDLGKDIASVRKDIESVRSDLTKEIASVRTDLTKEIASVCTDLTKEIESVRTDLTKEIAAARTDLTKEIGCVSANFTHLIKELELRMTIKLGLMLIASISIIGTIVKFF